MLSFVTEHIPIKIGPDVCNGCKNCVYLMDANVHRHTRTLRILSRAQNK